MGPLASNILLAHHLQADSAVVNGYDVLKLDLEIINYLAKLPVVDQRALSAIVSNSKTDTLYTLPSQTAR